MIPEPLICYRLADVEIMLWDLDIAGISAPDAAAVLPKSEVRAALGAPNPILRRRRLVGRFLIRTTLSGRMDQEPAELRFERGSHGKPSIPSGPSFNVSHSNRYLVLAIRPSGRVGIDLEFIRDAADLPDIARRFFSAAERREITHSMDGFTLAFYRVWVRKEAFLKATGFGLTLPLNSFSVSAAPLPPAENALTWIGLSGEDSNNWLVSSLDAPPGTALAFAADFTDPSGGPRP